MDGLSRILKRFIGVAIIVCITLFIFNFIMFGSLLFKGMVESESPRKVLARVVEDIQKNSSQLVLSKNTQEILDSNHVWAMMIGKEGKVEWNYKLPEEIPTVYEFTDIAKFSRNYLMDYPVFMWEIGNSLLVIGYPKDYYAKYQFVFPTKWIRSLPLRGMILFITNIVAVLLLSILLGSRLTKAIKPLIKGIHNLSKEKPTQVSINGLFSDVAISINNTSRILGKKEEALQKKDEARANWIAGISHDIRTPLSMILGYSSQLEENNEVDVEQRQQAAIIRKQAEKLKSLVSDLNLVSMLEYDMQPIHLSELRLSTIIRSIATEFLNNGLEDKYSIRTDISKEDIWIKVDKKLLGRAIVNLVNNSIIHNPNGCDVLIKTCTVMDSNECCIIVSDNGIGVSEKDLAVMTELPYAQGKKKSSTTKHGLGIPMVARIADAHGGNLVLESESNKGMVSIIRLPRIVKS